MNIHVLIVLLTLTSISNLLADSNATTNFFERYIDEKQKKLSKKVVEWSYNIDNGLSRWIYNADDEVYCDDIENRINERLFENQDGQIDEFFKSDKFINETEKRFLRIRLGSKFQSKESTEFKYKIRLEIPLNKTKKNIKLYIDNVERDYFTDTTVSDKNEESQSVGIRYFSEDYHKIKSRYSLGIRGLNPYVRARYYRSFQFFNWRIEPAQQFKYSIKYDWKEETNIYFDRKLEKSSLFRTTLYRGTKADVDGMDYAISFAYYHIGKRNTGLTISQSFWGNTKYKTIDKPKSYSGISNYETSVGWRQSIWRKWFIYEVRPAISFHRLYNYEPNYILNFNIELYFGNI